MHAEAERALNTIKELFLKAKLGDICWALNTITTVLWSLFGSYVICDQSCCKDKLSAMNNTMEQTIPSGWLGGAWMGNP